jgi:beta-fructofuranosidase
LVYSPHGVVKYFTGTLGSDYHFHPEVHGTVDLSTTYYAPNSLSDGNGRRIMWGWVRVKGDGWNGALSLPRVLTLRPDGRLGMAPAPELKALRRGHNRCENLTLTPASSHLLKDIRDDCLELSAEFEPGDAAAIGLEVRQSRDDKEGTSVYFDRDHKQLIAGPARGAFELLKEEKTLRLQVFLDRSVMEVYANGRECITSPLAGKARDGLKLSLFARGGSAKVRSIDIWQLKPGTD